MEKEEDDDEREKKSQMMAEYIEGAYDKKKFRYKIQDTLIF